MAGGNHVMEVRKSICRVCPHLCGVEVTTDGNRVLKVTGDRDDPIFRGYSCVKGRSHAAIYDHPDRLLHPLKRRTDGGFERIALSRAIDEIAERLSAIIERYGPHSVGFYYGTYFGTENPANLPVAAAFLAAIGSDLMFSPVTIDQSGKPLSRGFHGMWMAPGHAMHDPEVALLIGTNPVVSHQGVAGPPGDFLRRSTGPGKTLIVIDPRRTETAARAHLFLQARPGTDAAIMASLLNVILAEDLVDHDFAAEM
jgi:anaerobic selenocysteine-containing dehydrogenase